MARLIDADELKLRMETVEMFGIKGLMKTAREMVIASPTVDAIEVVRCRDCKHNSLKRVSGNTYCDLGIGLFQLYDYCSLGEKREDGKND